MHENLDNEELRRLWEHRLHVDNECYSRLNFFLIFESVLIGAGYTNVPVLLAVIHVEACNCASASRLPSLSLNHAS